MIYMNKIIINIVPFAIPALVRIIVNNICVSEGGVNNINELLTNDFKRFIKNIKLFLLGQPLLLLILTIFLQNHNNQTFVLIDY